MKNNKKKLILSRAFDFHDVLTATTTKLSIRSISLERGKFAEHSLSTSSLVIDLIIGGGYYPGKWISLIGETGSGKSSISFMSIKDAVKKGIPVLFLDYEGCVTEDTYIKTEKGLQTVGEILEEEDISFEGEDCFVKYEKKILSSDGMVVADKIYYAGKKKTRKLITKRHYELQGSLAHKALTLTRDLDLVWVDFEDIKPGDPIAIQNNNTDFPSDYPKLPDYTYSRPGSNVMRDYDLPTSLSAELCYILGMMCADVNASNKTQFKFTSVDKNSIDYLKYCFKKILPSLHYKEGYVSDPSTKRGKLFYFRFNSSLIWDFFENLGLGFQLSTTKKIPSVIRCCPKEGIVSFLSGYFDGDGSFSPASDSNNSLTISASSIRKDLLDDIRYLCLLLGSIGTVTPYKDGRHYYLAFTGRYASVLANALTPAHSEKFAKCREMCSYNLYSNLETIPFIKEKIEDIRLKGKNGCYEVDGEIRRVKIPNIPGLDVTYGYFKRNITTLGALSELGHEDLSVKIEKILKLGAYWDVVDTITDGGDRDVYDFYIKKDNILVPHSLWTNGIISHNSLDPNYLEKILGCKLADLIGKQNSKGKYTQEPLIYYYQPDTGEQGFRLINRLLQSLPVKTQIDGKWYFAYDKNYKTGFAEELKKENMSFFKDGDSIYVETDNGDSQALIFIDSLAAMNPEIADEKDEDNSLGMMAKMFSKQFRLIKSKIASRRFTVVSTNQLRLKPMVMYGSPEYQVGGEAVKFYPDAILKIKPVSASTVKMGKGAIVEEPSWDGKGIDRYKYSKLQTTKNKMFSPFREGVMRIWFESNGESGPGMDPFFDVYYYLVLTGQVEELRGQKFKFLIPGMWTQREWKWLEFKDLILNPNKIKVYQKYKLQDEDINKDLSKISELTEDKAVRAKALRTLNKKLKTMLDLKQLCFDQFPTNEAFDLYADALSGNMRSLDSGSDNVKEAGGSDVDDINELISETPTEVPTPAE